MLSKEAITQFQQIYFLEYGKDITFSEAQDKASKLLNLYRAVYAPINKILNKNNNEKNIQSKDNIQ